MKLIKFIINSFCCTKYASSLAHPYIAYITISLMDFFTTCFYITRRNLPIIREANKRDIKTREDFFSVWLSHTHTHTQTPPNPQRETLSWGDGSCKWHFVYIMRMWKMFFCMTETLIKWDCLYHKLNIFHLLRWGWGAGEGE